MMTWTPMPTGHPSPVGRDFVADGYRTILEDTHFGVWQRQRGLVDEALLARILPYVKEGGVALDVGAWNGEHAIAYARRASLVWAFEPQLPLFLNLCTNIFLGQHGNVIPVHAALGKAQGGGWTAPWNGDQENYGARPVSQLSGPSPAFAYSAAGCCRIHTIDTHAFDRVDFIKIDAEGWEPDILAGGRETILRDRPIMWIEVNDPCLRARGSNAAALVEQISIGFDYEVRAGTGAIGGAQWDALCIPRPQP